MSIQAHPCIGGKSIGEDIRRLEAGVHIVSGTPGRVFDMIRRRNLRTDGIKMLLLDEVSGIYFCCLVFARFRCLLCTQADELLNLGFKDQIYDIYRYLPPNTQVCLISATMTQEVLEMTTKFMTDPIRILVKRDELTLEGIKQARAALPRH